MSLFKEIHKFSNKIALIVPDQGFIKYSKLISESVKLTKNLEKRSTVFLLGRNDYEWIIGYLGFIKKKIIIILIDPDVNLSNLKQLIKDYKPKYIFKKKNTYTLNSCKTLLNYFNYELGEFDKYIIQKNYKELAILLTTSGTSGKNKFVRISYENLIANTRSIIKYLNIKNTDRLITTLQPSYSYGLSMLNTHLYNGASIVLNNYSIIEKNFWKLLKDNKVKTFGGVPYTYELLEKIKFHKFNITSLRYLTQAGGKLDNKIFQKINDVCEKNNIQFISMYGQTEATSRMSVLNFRYSLRKPTSIGKPLKGGKFYLLSDKNKSINKANISGNLFYKGKNVTLGYSNSFKDLSKKDKNKDIINTGDIAKFDDKGFFYIVGRKKRFIKLFGNRISLDEIEKLVSEMGFKIKCVNTDDKLMIKYMSDKIDVNMIKKKLSNLFQINPRYIDFKYQSNFNNKEKSL